MNTIDFLETAVQPAQMTRGRVLTFNDDGQLVVDCDTPEPTQLACDFLYTSEEGTLRLAKGDAVLVWLPDPEGKHGVVLGRIGPSSAPLPEDVTAEDEVPDELVIEAKQKLTLKCGEGSITLRGDGKILVRGKDLVSRAQRMNRIKGGAVAIN